MSAGFVSIHRSQASFSQDAVLTTNYLDNNIIQGNVFSITLDQAFTAETTNVGIVAEFAEL